MVMFLDDGTGGHTDRERAVRLSNHVHDTLTNLGVLRAEKVQIVPVRFFGQIVSLQQVFNGMVCLRTRSLYHCIDSSFKYQVVYTCVCLFSGTGLRQTVENQLRTAGAVNVPSKEFDDLCKNLLLCKSESTSEYCFVCVGVLRPSQLRSHVKPVS